jgi:hypothetical protein
MRRFFLTMLGIARLFLHVNPTAAGGPTTSVQGEYLMTLYVPLAEAHSGAEGVTRHFSHS